MPASNPYTSHTMQDHCRGTTFVRACIRRALSVALLPALVLLAFSTTAGDAVAKSRPDHTGLSKYASRHYTIYTNLGREQAREFAKHMDMVFAEYTYRFRSFPAKNRESLPLYLFRTREDYMSFLSRHGVDGSASGGIFFVNPRARGLATWTQGRSRRRVFAILQHEGFHQFAALRIGRNLPVWANEGLAEYFEKGIIVKGRMTLGLVPVQNVASLQNVLNEGRAFHFDDLFGMTHERWGRNLSGSDGRGQLQYEQSWSIVHFLVHANQGAYQPAFMKYITLVSRGDSSDEAFLKAFKARSTGAFRRRWEHFVRTQKPDAIGTTLDHMTFLGQGLEYLQKQGQPRPANVAELRERLQRIKFKVFVWHGGRPVEMSSLDESLYAFPHMKGGTGAFELLEPAADHLPQRIGAPGSKPEPILTWRIDSDGELISDFDFR